MLSSLFCTKAEGLGRNITCLGTGLSQAHLPTHPLDVIPHVSLGTSLHQLPSFSLPSSMTSSPLTTSQQLTNMFKAYLFWETEKIKSSFSILPTSEVTSLSLNFPRQLSLLIEFTPYLSSLFHCWCTPPTRANCLAASSIHWNSCSNDHQYPSKTQLQSLFCLACLWYFIYSYGHSLTHTLGVVSTQPAMLWMSKSLPSWFLLPIRTKDIGEGAEYYEKGKHHGIGNL